MIALVYLFESSVDFQSVAFCLFSGSAAQHGFLEVGRRALPCTWRTVLNKPNWKLQLSFVVEHSSLCRISREASKLTV